MKQLGQKYNQQLGKFGESLAVSYLQAKGYSILQKNFKDRYGEIDIIASKNSTTVFIEVKTRIGRLFGLPEEAVTKRKLLSLTHAAQVFLQKRKETSQEQQIDVIAVELFPDYALKALRHIENVTSWG